MSRETEGCDTLEDWRQCAKVEAGLRREAHAEIAKLRAPLSGEELRLVDKHCDWVAFRHAWNAVMKARAEPKITP